MKDLIQPEVRNEGEMRLWGAQVLKGHARSLLIYPKGNREPLTIHEERSDGVTLVFLVQSLEILSPEVPEEPDEKKGRLNPILTGASSKRSSVSRENEGGNIRPPPPPLNSSNPKLLTGSSAKTTIRVCRGLKRPRRT